MENKVSNACLKYHRRKQITHKHINTGNPVGHPTREREKKYYQVNPNDQDCKLYYTIDANGNRIFYKRYINIKLKKLGPVMRRYQCNVMRRVHPKYDVMMNKLLEVFHGNDNLTLLSSEYEINSDIANMNDFDDISVASDYTTVKF